MPGATAFISAAAGKTVWHMPEFLSQRTYIQDFENQPSVFTGDVETLKRVFPGKPYVELTSEEAELAKYAHNVFGALKVTYFNSVYDVCRKAGLDYGRVLKGVLASGYIGETHTAVPGPDGKFGYGGKCFPKDVRAAAGTYGAEPFGRLAACAEGLNEIFRSRKE